MIAIALNLAHRVQALKRTPENSPHARALKRVHVFYSNILAAARAKPKAYAPPTQYAIRNARHQHPPAMQ